MAVCGIYRMHPIVLRQAFKFSKIAQCERKKVFQRPKTDGMALYVLKSKPIYAYIYSIYRYILS